MGKNNTNIVIKVENVYKHFGEVKAVDGVSLEVPKGSVYGLLGPNGAGKTTLIRMMTTLLRPTKGQAIVGGEDVVDNPNFVRQNIGLAGQFAAVDEFQTGRENLEMVGRLYHLSKAKARQRADEVLKRFRLDQAAGRTVKTYSGGMRRRLDLGASLVAQPDILFLDEPTTGLDPRTRIELWDLIKSLVKDGTTILLTTQYLEEADELADMIGVIDKGKLVAEGTSSDLKTSLGSDVVEFRIVASDWSDKLGTAIKTAVNSQPAFDKDTGLVKVTVKRGATSMIKIVRVLDENRVTPIEFSLHRPSLDDVFLSVTGQKTKKGKS